MDIIEKIEEWSSSIVVGDNYDLVKPGIRHIIESNGGYYIDCEIDKELVRAMFKDNNYTGISEYAREIGRNQADPWEYYIATHS